MGGLGQTKGGKKRKREEKRRKRLDTDSRFQPKHYRFYEIEGARHLIRHSLK